MAFDLYITFAGLCLFRRPKGEKKEWIEVLLPPTKGHAHCHNDEASSAANPGVPGHYARLGYHMRYDPTLTSGPGKRFQEFEFAGKRLDLSSFGKSKSLNREFRHMDVVDITDVVEAPLKPANAIGVVRISAGSLCPGSVCEHSRGARWKLAHKEKQHMATLVTWRIRNVKEVVRGGEGLELKVTDLKGKNEERCGILRPVDGQIRIYLFHTPYDELPSQGVLPFQTWSSPGMDGTVDVVEGTKADHFRAYYELFHDPTVTAVPEFVDEGVDEDDEDDEGDEGDEEDPERDDPGVAGIARPKRQKLHLGYGRRYNCILTVVDDEGEA